MNYFKSIAHDIVWFIQSSETCKNLIVYVLCEQNLVEWIKLFNFANQQT